MIVTYGDAIVDLFALPRGSDVATAEQFVPRQGGAPANVAVVAARLGAAARFVGAVGDDAHGQRLVRELEAAGVDTRSMVTLANRTGVTFVRVGLDGARSFLFYRHGGADLSLTAEHIAALGTASLADATWLYFTSSALVSEPKAAATRALLTSAAEQNVPFVLDLNVRAHLWSDRERMIREVRALAARAVLIKASVEDLEAIDVPPTLDGLRSLVAISHAVAVLTLAERGALARVGEHELSVPAPSVDVIDATGAGDAFVGATLASLEAHRVRPGSRAWHDADAWRARLTLACSLGARAVTDLGATEALRDLSAERTALASG